MSIEPKKSSNRQWPYYTAKELRPKCGYQKFNKFEYFCKYVWCCGWFWPDKLWCSQLSSEILIPRRMISFRSMQSMQKEVRGCQQIKYKSKENLDPVKVQMPYETKGIVITDPKDPNKSDPYKGLTHRAIRFKETGTTPMCVSNTKPIKDHFRLVDDKIIRKERRDDKRNLRKDENHKVPNYIKNPEHVKRTQNSPSRNLITTVPNGTNNPDPRYYQSRKEHIKIHSDGLSRQNIITVPKCTKKPLHTKDRRHRSKRNNNCCRAAVLESRLQMIFIKYNPVMRRRAISFVNKPSLRRIPAKSSEASLVSDPEETSSRQKFKKDSQNPVKKVIKKIFSSGNKPNETSDKKDPVGISQINLEKDRGSGYIDGNYTCCILDPRKTGRLHKPSTTKVERKSILKPQLPVEEPVQSQGCTDTLQDDDVQTSYPESNKCKAPHNSFKTESVSSEERLHPKGKPISSRLFGWLFESKLHNYRDPNCLTEMNQNTKSRRAKSKEPVTNLYPCSVFNAQMKQIRSSKMAVNRSKEALSFRLKDEPMSTSKSSIPVRKSILSLKCIFLSDENSIQNTETTPHDHSVKPNNSSGHARYRQATAKKAYHCNHSKGKPFLRLFRECLGRKTKHEASDFVEEDEASVVSPLSGRKRFMACDGNTNIRQSSSKPKMMANIFTASSNSRLSSSESVLRYRKKPTIGE